MSNPFKKIAVMGAGAWGTALAQTIASKFEQNGPDGTVLLWAFEAACAASINDIHINEQFLPDVKLSSHIHATSNLADLSEMDAILAVVPAQFMRAQLAALAPHVGENMPIILCSKGIEHKSLQFMANVLEDTIPSAIACVLSGPSFAIDVAKGLPTAVTLAVDDQNIGADLADAIASPTFRPYLSDDIIGAEIGGAVKNVLAIGCGIVLGKNLGKSAHAALIARGFVEMRRLGEAMGADRETLAGLCGLGDLVLTCSSEQSRNMSCGLALGQGVSLSEIMGSRTAVTEGVATAPALVTLAKKYQVEMPICQAVAQILDQTITVDQAISILMGRARTVEHL